MAYNQIAPTSPSPEKKGKEKTTSFQLHDNFSYDIQIQAISERKYFIIVVLICFIHFTSCIYLFIIGIAHFSLQRNVEIQALNLYYPSKVAVVFLVVSFIHFYLLCKILKNCCRPIHHPDITIYKVEPSLSLNKQLYYRWHNFYHTYIGPMGVYGENGEMYEVRITIRECIDIPSQIFQCYILSSLIPHQGVAIVFSILISINCLVSAFLLNHKKYEVRRLYIILFNGIMDFGVTVVFPLLIISVLLRSWLLEENEKVIQDPYLGYRVMRLGSYVLITSLLDLVTTILPFITNAFMLSDLKNSIDFLICLKKPKIHRRSSVEELRRTKSLIKTTSKIGARPNLYYVAILCVVGVVAVAFHAIFFREQCDPSCSFEVYPWFTADCHCQYTHVNCALENITSDTALFERLESLSQHLSILHIGRCPLKQSPPEHLLVRFHNLRQLYFMDTPIEAWNISLQKLSTQLATVAVSNSRMSEISPFFYELPESVLILGFDGGNMTMLPLKSSVQWDNLYRLEIPSNKISQFPSDYLRLKKLERLTLGDNEIASIQLDFNDSYSNSIAHIRLSNNLLTEFPFQLLQALPLLKELYLEGNQIEEVDEKIITFIAASNLKVLKLSGNPMCNHQQKISHIASFLDLEYADICEAMCSPKCIPYIQGNYICNHNCFIKECNYDNGDCQRLYPNTFTYK